MKRSRPVRSVSVLFAVFVVAVAAFPATSSPSGSFGPQAPPNPGLAATSGPTMHGDSTSTKAFPFDGPGTRVGIERRTLGAACPTIVHGSNGYPVALCTSLLRRAPAATLVFENADGRVFHDQGIEIQGNVWSGDWYLPWGDAQGLVYFQHGFSRGGGNYRDLGLTLMGQGLMVLSLNAPMAGGNPVLARQVAESLAGKPPVPPGGTPLPERLLLSGHSAGALHVAWIAEHLVSLGPGGRIAGLIAVDPVDSSGAFESALTSLGMEGIPVLAVVSNPSACNNYNDTLDALRRLPPDFVGIRLIDRSTHIDVEGRNSDLLAVLVCGLPKRHNVGAVRDFTAAWSIDLLTGTRTDDFYPGGGRLHALLTEGRASLIKDTGGAWVTVLEESLDLAPLGQRRFVIEVPEIAVGLVEIGLAGSGRAALYVRRDGVASPWQHDCHAPGLGNAPLCLLAGPGRYEILVRAGLRSFNGTLGARYYAY